MTVIIALLLQLGIMNGDLDTNRSNQDNDHSTIVIDELIIGNID